MQTPLLRIQTIFVISRTLRRLLTGHAVAQNYVFVVLQPETTKNNSHDYLVRHVKETIVMKILQQFRTNVNYMA